MPGRRIASAGLGLVQRGLSKHRMPMLRQLLSYRSQPGSSAFDSSRSGSALAHTRRASSAYPEGHEPARMTWSKAILAGAPLTATGAAAAEAADPSYGGIGQYLAELLLSSPIPSYGLTIVVLTLVFRTVFTLPITAWQNRRMRRLMLQQAPDMRAVADRIAKEIGPTAVRNGWTNEMFQQEIALRTNAEYERLMKPLKTRQRWLRFAPLLANLPILIGFSYAIRTALNLPGSPLSDASFLWVEKLGSVDVGLGIAGMLVTFLNAEIQSRNSLKLLDKEDAAKEKRDAQVALQERLAAERAVKDREEAKRIQAAKLQSSQARARVAAKPAPLPAKAAKAAAARKTQRPAATTSSPPKPLASTRDQPFADEPGTSAAGRQLPKTPAAAWAWAKARFEKTLSPAYTLHIYSQFSRLYGVGFFVLASLFVPSGLSLYWFTSMLYTLLQTSALSFFGKEAGPAVELKTKSTDADALNAQLAALQRHAPPGPAGAKRTKHVTGESGRQEKWK